MILTYHHWTRHFIDKTYHNIFLNATPRFMLATFLFFSYTVSQMARIAWQRFIILTVKLSREGLRAANRGDIGKAYLAVTGSSQ